MQERLDPSIDIIVEVINNTTDSRYVRGEYFGYSLNRIIRRFMQTVDSMEPSFNSILFVEPKKKTLNTASDAIASILSGGDPTELAADLQYVIKKMLHKSCTKVVEGMQDVIIDNGTLLYFHGVLESIKESLRDAKYENNADQKHRLMRFRRYSVVLGVLKTIDF